ncbi:hypothetical protein NHX12_023500 [Muraenolepis orangiensis]|uniref:Uncharacterized protein n=1 Tax=Muraenolepis orangiensis TaxID=630683 RepID=A0A9Q0ER21_9TELE|nr:hypothetical protein NHX12_023500 [Muraenolepis orangiensis]
MKYSLIVAIVVLALAQGTLSDTPELEKATKFLEGVGDELVSTFQKTLETLQSQENFAPLAASVQEQITPLAESLQEKIKPFVDDLQKKMEDLFRKLADQPRLG